MSNRNHQKADIGHPNTIRLRIFGFVISLIVRLILLSVRVTKHGPDFDRSGVIAFWHGDQLPLLSVRPTSDAIAPVSLSKDGTLQANVLNQFGIGIVRGSSSRGGVSALRRMLSALSAGSKLLIAVDGPRGPMHKAKLGATYLAMKANVPLWCVGVFATRAIRLRRSWDQFMIPLPFSRIYINVSEPKYFGAGSNACSPELEIEESLHALKQLAKTHASSK